MDDDKSVKRLETLSVRVDQHTKKLIKAIRKELSSRSDGQVVELAIKRLAEKMDIKAEAD